MNICLVSGIFPPDSRGGAENYVITVAQALEARGHEAFVLTTEPADGLSSLRPRYEQVEGIDVWRFFPLHFAHRSTYERRGLPAQALWRMLDACNPHAAMAANRVLAHKTPDVVHVNDLEGISTLVPRVARRHSAKCVFTLHNYALVCPSASPRLDQGPATSINQSLGNPPLVCQGFSHFQKRLLGEIDVAIGPSQYILDTHTSAGFFSDARCRMIQHGIETVATDPPAPTGPPSVLFVGRLHAIKGVDPVIRMAERLDDIQVHICGTGPLSDKVERAAARVENLIYHGYVPNARLGDLRRKATVGVVPSIWPENSPLTIYESFAAGLPVVGSNVGGIPELISPSDTGQLCTPGDVQSLTRAVRDVVSDPRLTEMRANALTWARRRTLDQHMDALLDVYRS